MRPLGLPAGGRTDRLVSRGSGVAGVVRAPSRKWSALPSLPKGAATLNGKVQPWATKKS